MNQKEHWDEVYRKKRPDELSWYELHLARSLAFIEGAHLPPEAAILDVGGGASTLVDDLLNRGYVNVTVLDLSREAIERTRMRLGDRGAHVRWIVGDVTKDALPE